MYSLFDISIFSVFVIIALYIDLHMHNKDEKISINNAIGWSIFWVVLSLAFSVYIYFTHGADDSKLFLTGYVLEKTLSVDNLFVMMAVFTCFKVKDAYMHRVLYYGIIGALVLRLLFITLGTGFIISTREVGMCILACVIFYTAIMMIKNANKKDEDNDDDTKDKYVNNILVNIAKKLFPTYNSIDNHNFFTKIDGKYHITPLFLCLLSIEFVDILFAFDSVPVIIAITEKPFLVYSSNIFAILGLRSLYFVLVAMKNKLEYLEHSVIIVLMFISCKLVATVFGYHITPTISLSVIFSALTVGMVISIITNKLNKN